jgi:hypothetical protein
MIGLYDRPTQNGHETEGTSFPDQLAVTEEGRRLSFGRTAASAVRA